ncbi:hypothetical protein EVAR_94471_1 [Eumeta japonica]|uniref:Uncharacterized protein n=1 Tax=Eumeta variegata TaxID=151549 RepID=A0A4C1UWJ8_EUMVA|nr:hypothetical protein EVAR_94471_1 [Eumeta japonica]
MQVKECAWDETGGFATSGSYKRQLQAHNATNKARLMAVLISESEVWLHALPSPNFGILLDDNSLRVVVAFRLGYNVCELHLCICGSTEEANGYHGLSCQRSSHRNLRKYALNDILRTPISAKVSFTIELSDLSRLDAASRAESVAKQKLLKYSILKDAYLFIPVVCETSGPRGSEAKFFIKQLGRRLRNKGEVAETERNCGSTSKRNVSNEHFGSRGWCSAPPEPPQRARACAMRDDTFKHDVNIHDLRYDPTADDLRVVECLWSFV